MNYNGGRRKGCPKNNWLDTVKDDMRENGLSREVVYARAIRRRISLCIDPNKSWNKTKRKKKEKTKTTGG